MSKQWENVVAREVYRNVSDVKAYRCGFSGSNAMPQPDVLLTEPHGDCHAIEAKGPLRDDTCYVPHDDVQQLIACEGPATAVYLLVKFSRRKPLVVRYYDDITGRDWDDKTAAEKFAVMIPECFDARVTDSETLALDKPPTERWDSATTSPPDWQVVAQSCGIRTEQSTDLDV